MDTSIEQLRSSFEPFDLPHFLGFVVVLTLFVFLWGLIVTSSGGYPTARQFWQVHLVILGSAYMLSALGFLLLHIDPLLLLLSLVCISFIIQSNLGTPD